MERCIDRFGFSFYTEGKQGKEPSHLEKKSTKYQELIDYVYNLIDDGTLKSGDRLFSENELSAMFHISRQTVRRAIGELEENGVVKRIRGSGTYIGDNRQENLKKRNRIAVVTTYVDSYIFPKTIQGIEKVLSEHGYFVQIAFTNNTLEREKSVLEDMISQDDVAGVIVEGTKSGLPNPNLFLYRKLMKRRIPILFFNTFYPELDVPHVSLNDVEAGSKAVQFLIEKGHKDIGAILKLDDGQGRLRYLGYLNAMEAAGLPVKDSRMIWIDTEESRQLSLCMDRILSRLEGCSAVLCYNDQVAFQLIHLLRERKIAIPEQLAVISIDDSDLARHSEVPITSLPHPKEKLGEAAANRLLEMLNGRYKNATFEFSTRVVERESTG